VLEKWAKVTHPVPGSFSVFGRVGNKILGILAVVLKTLNLFGLYSPQLAANG
jgi:hypothetical protein